MTSPTRLTIRRPDDWHVHLRDGALLAGVAPWTARQFARAIVMPNLSPPMTDVAGVAAYRDRILAALPEGITPPDSGHVLVSADLLEQARLKADGSAVLWKIM